MNRFMTSYLIAMLMVSPAVLAQTTSGTDTVTAGSSTEGGFDALSSGNQMIARSLMNAEVVPPDGGEIWTLDQIAAAKSTTGWGNVFRQMQAEGLVDAKNLGQVVSSYARSTQTAVPASVAADVETEGDTAASSEAEHRSTNTADSDTKTDSDEVAKSGQDPEDTEGAFAKLSPGNQKIARSLMNAQTLPADDGTQPWDLDQIAAAKGQTGWGNVFKQMHSEGLIDARNLGQVVSRYNADAVVSAAAPEGAAVAATDGTTTLRGGDHGAADTHIDDGAGHVAASVSIGHGHAYGLNQGSISASDDITTAAGTTVNMGAGDAEMAATAGNSSVAVSATGHAAGNGAVAISSTSVSVDAGEHGAGHAYGHLK